MYGEDPLARRSFRIFAYGKGLERPKAKLWNMMTRGFATAMHLHLYLPLAVGIMLLVGDNQSEIEGPLRPDQFRGRLTEVIRNGRQFSVQNPLYRLLTSIWLFLCPVRPFFHRFCALLRRLHT